MASIDVVNTGNIGIEVEVVVEFSQLGSAPLEYTETAEVEVDESIAVHFDENISRDQWFRYSDSGNNCEYEVTIVEEFGDVVD